MALLVLGAPHRDAPLLIAAVAVFAVALALAVRDLVDGRTPADVPPHAGDAGL